MNEMMILRDRDVPGAMRRRLVQCWSDASVAVQGRCRAGLLSGRPGLCVLFFVCARCAGATSGPLGMPASRGQGAERSFQAGAETTTKTQGSRVRGAKQWGAFLKSRASPPAHLETMPWRAVLIGEAREYAVEHAERGGLHTEIQD